MDKNEKCCCSKESNEHIPMSRIIDKLDSFFAVNDLDGAQRLLEYWKDEAERIGDERGLLEILSECAGLYRRTGNGEKGLDSCEKAITIIEDNNLEETVSGATILLNCATTMKSFGKVQQAIPYYERAEKTLVSKLEPNDKRLAGLFNNKATALSDLGKIEEAKELYLKAIEILKEYDDSYPEIAVSYVNLGQMINMNDPFDEEAFSYMEKAWSFLNKEGIPFDSNYAFVASKCAPAFKEMGFFKYSEELERRSEEIYAGN